MPRKRDQRAYRAQPEVKARMLAQARHRRGANLEKYREREKKYRDANREKVRERNRKYLAENRDKIRERRRKSDALRREEIRKLQRERYAANPERCRESRRKWYAKNRVKIRERRHNASPEEIRERKAKQRESDRKRYAANPEKYRERDRKYKAARRSKIQEYDRKRLYGITTEQFTSMLAAQGGVCLCGDPWGETKMLRLAVDHCHKTGRVRAILHHRCNMWVGDRDPNILKRFRNK
jgi:hypothetical protein